jgi:hypothetical protein
MRCVVSADFIKIEVDKFEVPRPKRSACFEACEIESVLRIKQIRTRRQEAKEEEKIRRLYTVPAEVLPDRQNLIHDSGRDRRTHPTVQRQNPLRFRARSSVQNLKSSLLPGRSLARFVVN